MAVARLMAAPRSSATRVRAGPSSCLAFRWRSSRSPTFQGQTESGQGPVSTDIAAHTVTASAGRRVAAHR